MRLIDADELKRRAYSLWAITPTESAIILRVIAQINEATTIEAVPVQRGEWVRTETEDLRYRCNYCGENYIPATKLRWNFCHNCGADMRKPISDENDGGIV